MHDKIFTDSNIWLYAFMESDSPKKKIAADVILNKDVILSTQVVNEICVNLIKKANYTDLDILTLLRNLQDKYAIYELYFETLIKGTELRIEYKLSFWDSLIVATALENDCTILYTEDLQAGLIIKNTLTIVNPFK
jgi:predicted nucleic acid-binding protein